MARVAFILLNYSASPPCGITPAARAAPRTLYASAIAYTKLAPSSRKWRLLRAVSLCAARQRTGTARVIFVAADALRPRVYREEVSVLPRLPSRHRDPDHARRRAEMDPPFPRAAPVPPSDEMRLVEQRACARAMCSHQHPGMPAHIFHVSVACWHGYRSQICTIPFNYIHGRAPAMTIAARFEHRPRIGVVPSFGANHPSPNLHSIRRFRAHFHTCYAARASATPHTLLLDRASRVGENLLKPLILHSINHSMMLNNTISSFHAAFPDCRKTIQIDLYLPLLCLRFALTPPIASRLLHDTPLTLLGFIM